MTAYVVTISAWDDSVVSGVFSTREKAEKYINTLEEEDRINSEILPFVIV